MISLEKELTATQTTIFPGIRKSLRFGLFVLVGASLITSYSSCAPSPEKTMDSIAQILDLGIPNVIAQSKDIPAHLKVDLTQTWNQLVENKYLNITGTDIALRPVFVTLQGLVEQVIASQLGNEIITFSGAIHTPMPATPLCTKGEISPGLVNTSIAKDPNRIFTVQARTTIIRDLLFKGGILTIAYPSNGINERTAEQQAIYRQELNKYPNLIDKPLDCASLPPDLTGATYIFKDKMGKNFAFSIQFTQANTTSDQGNYCLWYGPADDLAIQTRIEKIFSFLNL